jgi:hypothetical protein
MFVACCCTDAEDKNQITYHSTTEEGAALPQALSAAAQPPGAKVQSAAGTGRSEGESARSVPSLTPSEKEAEKARLQQLVNSFAKRAVRGCPCTYLKEVTGERCSTQYRIDKSLEYLIVMSDKDPNRAEVTCPIAAIQDIYSFVEDGEACFPVNVVQTLKGEEQELLLMVVYRSGADKMYRFCLLEESQKSRDDILECLRILCIYAQSAPADRTGPAQGS